MDVITLISGILCSVSLLFYLAAFYYVMKIRNFTKGFKQVWTYVLFGLIFLIFLSIVKISFMITDSSNALLWVNLLTSVFSLLASFSFAYGFFKLGEVFGEISHKKTFMYRMKGLS